MIVLPPDPVPVLVGLTYRVVQRMEVRSRGVFYTLREVQVLTDWYRQTDVGNDRTAIFDDTTQES